MTKDHIFPKSVCVDHYLVLGSIKGQNCNLVKICWNDHSEIEKRKSAGYRGGNLVGLIEEVANYPRSSDPMLYERQYGQWIDLFTVLRDNLTGLNGLTPPHLLGQYKVAEEVVAGCLYKWKKGDFDILLPVLITE